MNKRAILAAAIQIAKKRKMAMGGEVEDDDYETPMSLQEAGEYHPDLMGGSEDLAKALGALGGQMAMGGLVGDEVAPQSAEAKPDDVKTVPPVSLKDSDLTEEAKKALADKKSRRRFKQ